MAKYGHHTKKTALKFKRILKKQGYPSVTIKKAPAKSQYNYVVERKGRIPK